MKTELNTAIHLRSIRIAALALPIVAAFTSILAWILGRIYTIKRRRGLLHCG